MSEQNLKISSRNKTFVLVMLVFLSFIATVVAMNYAYEKNRTCPDGYREEWIVPTYTSKGTDSFGSFHIECSNRLIEVGASETVFMIQELIDNGYFSNSDMDGVCISYTHNDPKGHEYSRHENACYMEFNDEHEVNRVFVNTIGNVIDISNVNMLYMEYEKNHDESEPRLISEETTKDSFLTLLESDVSLFYDDEDNLELLQTGMGTHAVRLGSSR